MNVEIKTQPELRLAALAHAGAYERISETFGRLGATAGPSGLLQGKPQMVAIYYDNPQTTPEPRLRSDAALIVSADSAIPAGLLERRLGAGRYARTLHLGPYEELGALWARLMGEWLPQSGEQPGPQPSYEIYLNNPMQVPKAELRTELYLSLT